MKKLLLCVACCIASLGSMAQTETKSYTDALVVTVDGTASDMTATVTVEELQDNYINFVLKNFILKSGEDELYVGNIEINNLYLRDKGEYSSFTYNGNLKIKEGDLEGVDMWVGPDLGNVPLVLAGKISGDKLYVNIDIDLKSLEQIINVKFGKDEFAKASVVSTNNYTDKLEVLVPTGEEYAPFSSMSDVKANIEKLSTGSVNFVLPNFVLDMGENGTLPMGDMTISDIDIVDHVNYSSFTVSGKCVFSGETEMAGYSCAATLNGKFSDGKLYFTMLLDTKELFNAQLYYVYGTEFEATPAVGEAKTYADNLTVVVDGESTDPIPANVSVQPLSNGGINFNLQNFHLVMPDSDLPIGNIAIEDLKLEDGPGYKYFDFTGDIAIQNGDEAGVDYWAGPDLGEIPLRMRGRITDEKLYVNIDIFMESLQQTIYVTFGTQIDPVDGVSSVEVTASKAVVYDLQGRQVSNSNLRGIYVINGKKVLK